MTVPMIVLAFGSVGAGFLLYYDHVLVDWLAPSLGELEEPHGGAIAARARAVPGRRVLRARRADRLADRRAQARRRWSGPSRCRCRCARPAATCTPTRSTRRSSPGPAPGSPGRWSTWTTAASTASSTAPRPCSAAARAGCAGCRPGSSAPTRCPCSAARPGRRGAAGGAVRMNGGNVLLLVLLLLPLVGALVVAPLRATRGAAKLAAMGFALASLVLTAVAWFAYSVCRRRGRHPVPARVRRATGSRRSAPGFALGIDGIALVMLALIAVLVPIVMGFSWDGEAARGPHRGRVLRAAAGHPGPAGRGVRGHRRVPVLRVLRGHAGPDVLPDRPLRRAAPAVRGGEVLPVLAARRADHAGLGDRAVRRERRPAGRGHVHLGRAAVDRRHACRSPRRSGCSSGSSSRSRSRRRWCRSTPGCPTPVPRPRSGRACCWSACWTRSARSASCATACRCSRWRRSGSRRWCSPSP